MKDLNKKKDKELMKELETLKEKNNSMKFSAAGNTKDSFERRKNRKKIARILTEINNRK